MAVESNTATTWRPAPGENSRSPRVGGASRPVGGSWVVAGATPTLSGALPAGRTVRRGARVTGASVPGADSASARAANRWRGATHEQTQRPVVGAFLRALGQGRRMNGSEHGTATGVHHGHHDLRPARRVEHDPVELWAAAGDLHECACGWWLHRRSVSRARCRDGVSSSRRMPTPRRGVTFPPPGGSDLERRPRREPIALAGHSLGPNPSASPSTSSHRRSSYRSARERR